MTSPVPPPGFSFARAALLSLVAGLLAAVIWFGAGIKALRTEVAALETERDLAKTAQLLAEAQLKERTLVAEGMINDLRRQLHTTPRFSRFKVIVLASSDGAPPQGLFLWDPQRRAGSFIGWHLPPPPTGEAYLLQLADLTSKGSILMTSLDVKSDGKATTEFDGTDVELTENIRVSVEVIETGTSANVRTLLSGR